MKQIDYLNYDIAVDHLTISNTHEKIVSNIDTGFAILSLNAKREIVGIELMGMNKNFKVPYEVLTHLTECHVEIRYEPHTKRVIISISLKHKKAESPIIVASQTDLGEYAFSENLSCIATA